jgi:hypothetical protein
MRRAAISIIIVLALCECVWAWTVPVPVNEVNTNYHDKAPFLSYDGLNLYFSRADGPGWHYARIYQATRESPDGPFGSVQEISTLNDLANHVDYPWVSADNKRMYYYKTIVGGSELKFTQRDTTDEVWLPGVNISELNALGDVSTPSLTPDELTIVFTGYNFWSGQGGYDVYMATRPNRYSPFGEATNLAGINSAAWDFHPSISPDGLSLVFASMRNGTSQLFTATRVSTDEPFGNAEHLSFFDSAGSQLQYPFMSSDGMALYFTNSINGSDFDIYVSYIPEPGTLLLLGIGALISRKRRACAPQR